VAIGGIMLAWVFRTGEGAVTAYFVRVLGRHVGPGRAYPQNSMIRPTTRT